MRRQRQTRTASECDTWKELQSRRSLRNPVERRSNTSLELRRPPGKESSAIARKTAQPAVAKAKCGGMMDATSITPDRPQSAKTVLYEAQAVFSSCHGAGCCVG